jgi:Nif-specific regulatory protein
MKSEANQMVQVSKIDFEQVLLEISQSLCRSQSLRESLETGLRILKTHGIIHSGLISLVDEAQGVLQPQAEAGGHGQLQAAVCRLGDGLDGRVAESGQPILVLRLSKEPLFVDRARHWDLQNDGEMGYIGVPLALEFKTLGVLSVLLPYRAGQD